MFSKNSVVLYKNQPAIVAECGEKYTIQFASGPKLQTASQSVRAKDITLLHEGAASSVKTLHEQAQLLEQNAAAYESAAKEAHELYAAEGAPASLAELSEIIFGDFAADKSWAYYSYLRASPLFAETQTDGRICFSCRSESEVQELERKANEKDQEAELRQACAKLLRAKQPPLPEHSKYMQEIEAVALGRSEKSRLLKEAGFAESAEAAHKVLLDCGFWPYWRNPFPSRCGLSTQSASEKLSRPPAEERLELAHTAFAIDNSWSGDPDDAVAFDGEHLWVHIADPASTVLPGSSIDKAARSRGSTLYLPEGAVRMLAEESLEDYALGLGERSNALSFRLKLDENGAIADTAVFKTLVKVKRLTYEEADAQKGGAELAPLFAIAERNAARRKNAGAVFIDLPEVHISVERNAQSGEPLVRIVPIKETLASAMVREMMLLAGEGAARFAFKNNIPFPFISQEAPDIPKELPGGLAGQFRLRRAMRSRSVGVSPSVHSGLGLGMYSQATSPLRRYSDLVAHQQLRAFLDKRPLLDKDAVLERISAGDAAASATVKASRKSDLHWTLCFLQQNPEWRGTGVVVELRDKKAAVLIPELALETQIAADGYELNQEIALKTAKIDIVNQLVSFLAV